ncbi:hypothetical protein C5B42_03675 [Candidatus Cerribacteria bacterium 'Amazon FNV 2010 28 9']|uniref:FHA domain-containing protein n=1 Tax=Candidatus Cerribacteria bacterium 'Amazon FNV 2010 28 9' TaxID=2081795 RepID=A0A317JNV0_9BACT|nr:MAG: hypothetical protein C5B42_03675 [Candidatus Cerribacteria bacterium 'Amazon FNV 2010 28 9']
MDKQAPDYSNTSDTLFTPWRESEIDKISQLVEDLSDDELIDRYDENEEEMQRLEKALEKRRTAKAVFESQLVKRNKERTGARSVRAIMEGINTFFRRDNDEVKHQEPPKPSHRAETPIVTTPNKDDEVNQMKIAGVQDVSNFRETQVSKAGVKNPVQEIPIGDLQHKMNHEAQKQGHQRIYLELHPGKEISLGRQDFIANKDDHRFDFISRQHITISRGSNTFSSNVFSGHPQFFVRNTTLDTDKENSVYVNGVKIDKNYLKALKDKDVIALSGLNLGVGFVFHENEDDDAWLEPYKPSTKNL